LSFQLRLKEVARGLTRKHSNEGDQRAGIGLLVQAITRLRGQRNTVARSPTRDIIGTPSPSFS
jgi:hypothetical protein